MRIHEIIIEAKVPSVRDQIIADVKKHGPGQYFVRFTGTDKLGYSAKQWFGKTPDADHPDFDVDYIGHGKGRPVLWFYPLETYLDKTGTVYASEQPYAWLVKLKPDAWLQPIKRGESGIKPAPAGKERVGILRMSRPPAALFFTHGYDLIGKYYDYAGQHKRHGEVKGPEVKKLSFFDRVRGVSENFDDLDEGWKDWVASAALGAAALSPQTSDAKSVPQKPAITQQVQGDANYATKLILKPEAKILIQTARAAGMRGKELAQFIAQCAHETANFSSLKEIGGKLDFKKYDPKFNPRKAKILGNKQVGDGAKYHGRGYIQLTGRDNYKRAGQALGLPLEERPELVERPEIAAKVAVWFWQNQVAPKVSNFNDTAQVTKPINSGLKGLDDRHNKFASIVALMGSKT